jgi:Activator of Hsp90 ATPase homolog 1-like protein
MSPQDTTGKDTTVSSQNYSTTLIGDQTPDEAFAAITNVRGWWSGEIEGSTDQLGAEFSYRHQDVHYSKQRISELVLDAYLNFTEDPDEWVGTDVTFELTRKGDQTEVSFSHLGLIPEFECFDKCSHAWGFYINSSLRNLITTRTGAPNPKENRVES